MCLSQNSLMPPQCLGNILRQKRCHQFKFMHLIQLKANVQGEAMEFEGEASPLPPLDETLHVINNTTSSVQAEIVYAGFDSSDQVTTGTHAVLTYMLHTLTYSYP